MSEYADLGTAAHKVLESCLESIYGWGLEIRAREYVGQEIEVADEPHARLSPSGAKRYFQCPASVRMNEKYPEASQGPRVVVFDEDYATAVQVTLDYIAERMQAIAEMTREPVQVFAERRVSLDSNGFSGEFDGTVDITILSGTYCEIVDFKAGAGVAVSSFDPQLDLYFTGTIAELSAKYCDTLENKLNTPSIAAARLTIVQPRCDKVEPRIRYRELAGKDLATLINDTVARCRTTLNIVTAIDEGADMDPHFHPSEDGCRFCNVGGGAKYSGAPVCKAYADFALQQTGVCMDGLPESVSGILDAAESFAARDTRILSPEQLVGILRAREILSGALQATEAWGQSLLEAGVAPPALIDAFKLVHKQSRRRYIDGEEATFKGLKRIKIPADGKDGKLRALGKKDLYEARLKSVASVEKLLKGAGIGRDDSRFKAFERLVTRPEGGLTIAPRSDPREEVLSRRPDADAVMGEAEELEAPPAA